MSALTDLFSGAGWFLFGVAAVLFTTFLLRMVRRFDRIISLAEIGAVNQLPTVMRTLVRLRKSRGAANNARGACNQQPLSVT